MKQIAFLLVISLFLSCSASKKTTDFQKDDNSAPQLVNDETFLLKTQSKDKIYGYSEQNPIKVGGVWEGSLNERRFLNALAGPKGEKVSYHRLGSCCQFKTEKGIFGTGMLDKYQVTLEGKKDTLILYINMYDYEELKVPAGFTTKKMK